ncbi:hypothetical protein QN277_003214 [Acacia crassicarpa]|uniref:Uncharacterized protein n=1 Tax=Acacia crassicarpa TaxID=499986 RepID=A0AAE1IZS2_9FABA|nr:hypothetical protein QN277_003214 [Acacia crassicarpa]
MSDREDDNDAPEEFTAAQGAQQEEEIRKIQKESKVRVNREKKEHRRKLAQRLTPRPSKKGKDSQDVSETETEQLSADDAGFLPESIVQIIAASEKQVFLSESDDEDKVKTTSRKKKSKKAGLNDDDGPIVLDESGPPPCLQSSLEFLKRRKMEVPRSSSVLNNSNRALRLLTGSGVLGRN